MPRSAKRLAECGRLRASRHEDEDAFRIEVLRPLNEGGEIRVRHREAHRSDDLAPRLLERVGERGLEVVAGAVVGHHGVALLDAALRRPAAEGVHDLRQRRRGADHVRRLGDDDRGRGVHHHHELLGLRRYVGGRKRVRRQHPAGKNVGLVADHQLLRETLGDVGRGAAGVLADDLDLLAGDGVAELFHVGLDAVVELCARIGELTRRRHHDADLHAVLRLHGRRRACGEGDCAHTHEQLSHVILPNLIVGNGTGCVERGQFYSLRRGALERHARCDKCAGEAWQQSAQSRGSGGPRPSRGRRSRRSRLAVRRASRDRLTGGATGSAPFPLILLPQRRGLTVAQPTLSAIHERTMRRLVLSGIIAALLALTAAPTAYAEPDAPHIAWEVKNRFRLFRSEADFRRHIDARGDSILAAEQLLARASDGRGWARDTVERLCTDRGGRLLEVCERDGQREVLSQPTRSSGRGYARRRAAAVRVLRLELRRWRRPCPYGEDRLHRGSEAAGPLRQADARRRRHPAARRHRATGHRPKSRCATS